MKFQNAVSFLFRKGSEVGKRLSQLGNSRITAKRNIFHFCQVDRQLFLLFVVVNVHYYDLSMSLSWNFNFFHWTDATDGQQTDNRQTI